MVRVKVGVWFGFGFGLGLGLRLGLDVLGEDHLFARLGHRSLDENRKGESLGAIIERNGLWQEGLGRDADASG